MGSDLLSPWGLGSDLCWSLLHNLLTHECVHQPRRVFMEVPLYRHGWVNHLPLVFPQSPPWRSGMALQISALYSNGWIPPQPAPMLKLSGGTRSRLISINSGTIERVLLGVAKDTPVSPLADYTGSRSSCSRNQDEDNTYISYSVTVSQKKWVWPQSTGMIWSQRTQPQTQPCRLSAKWQGPSPLPLPFLGSWGPLNYCGREFIRWHVNLLEIQNKCMSSMQNI